MREQLYQEIDTRAADFGALSDAIWDYAETAFEETKSAKLLADFLEAEGFTVTRGVANIATAFTATYGTEGTHIGILGEYDALADLDQESMNPHKSEPTGKPGQGCGHNLLGVGALAAACAVKKYLAEGHPGRVTYFGCPAEEGGSGKTFMARDGVFDDLDAALTWHPAGDNTVSYGSSLANYQVVYRFRGVAAHAAGDPHLGRSALDAVELMNVGVQFLREHIPTTARVHYAITDTGGYSPNVVQPTASVLYLIRMPQVTDLPELYARVNDIAKGAALMTGTTEEHEFIKACSNLVANTPLAQRIHDNIESLMPMEYSEEELAFANELRKSLPNAKPGDPFATTVAPLPAQEGAGSGSTDVGDVSWVCPTGYFYIATNPKDVPGHSWQKTACGKSSFAKRGMLLAAKVIAATAVDLYEDPALLEAAKEDLKRRTGGKYECPIPQGVKPRIISQIK